MPKIIGSELPPELHAVWTNIDKPMQATIRQTLTSIRKYQYDIDLTMMMLMWRKQIPPEVGLACCAVTKAVFMPAGLFRPYIFSVDPDKGYAWGNICFVSHGYWALRKITRLTGPEGHRRAWKWACAFADMPEDREILQPFAEETKGPDFGVGSSNPVAIGASLDDDGNPVEVSDET